jgi:hypothetical protein
MARLIGVEQSDELLVVRRMLAVSLLVHIMDRYTTYYSRSVRHHIHEGKKIILICSFCVNYDADTTMNFRWWITCAY